MAKFATSVRYVTWRDGTVPKAGIMGCCRYPSLDNGVKLQKFSASPCSFLDFAYNLVRHLINVYLFWGENPKWWESGGTGATGDTGGHRAAQESGQWGQLQARASKLQQALPAYSGSQALGNSDMDSSLPQQLSCHWHSIFEGWNFLFFPNTTII